MPGVTKHHSKRNYARAFPASRYVDPRGGRASALERNILRYRATEAAVYLFYAEQVRDFMLTDVHRAAVRQPGIAIWEWPEEQRLQRVFGNLLKDAETEKKLTSADADVLRRVFASERQQGKKLKVAFTYAVAIGIFTEAEAAELKALLDYRNEIAHRIHKVMSDISRNYWAIDHVACAARTYKGDALDRLRVYTHSLWERARSKLLLTLSMDSMLFELAEHAFDQDLRRLDRLITKQIASERERNRAINAELDLRETGLVDDLSPRFPANHRPGHQGYGDDYIPATGHLSKRGVEICYRLFDLGKSPTAVAYLMGMTLRSAERRQRSWFEAGGLQRVRAKVERYDVRSMKPLAPG
jgi:fructose-specific component phosphotransferase system IIB-like protein